jgi:NAD(P)-dependent dehydrogenase (short-subunit alcohol dehydrogenase family)
MSSLAGKNAVVTGGSRGIGLAVARALVGAGARVGILGSTETHLAAAAATLSAISGPDRVATAVADVRRVADVTAAIDRMVGSWDGLDILVNNAGIGVFRPVADMSIDDWQRVLDTNLSGVFHACRASLPHLRRRGGGWIVNVSSLSSTGPFPGGAAYCASKAGVNAFSDALMQEVRHEGIRVTVVLPGSVDTEFSGRTPDGSDWRLSPDDVAQTILGLFSHPPRSLPSRVEIRPSRPPRKS